MPFEITTGKPVSDHTLTPTHPHTHTDNTQWSLCRSARASPPSRGNGPKPVELNDGKYEDCSVPSPTTLCFPSLISPRKEGRYNLIHHLYSLSFRTEIHIDLLANKRVLPSIFTSSDLHLTMYNMSKPVPATRDRFMRSILRFLLGPVFSTTSAPIKLRIHRYAPD